MTRKHSSLSFSTHEAIKGHPLSMYDQIAFWRDLDNHLAVFHKTNRNRRGKDKLSPATQLDASLLNNEDVILLKHIKVL